MTEVVLDASVLSHWIPETRTGPAPEALELAAEYEAGRLTVVAPTFIQLELLDIAGRQWRWPEDGLTELVRFLARLRVELVEPELEGVAAWIARGLTAYDAAYVAVAEQRGIRLVTRDADIIRIASGIAQPL